MSLLALMTDGSSAWSMSLLMPLIIMVGFLLRAACASNSGTEESLVSALSLSSEVLKSILAALLERGLVPTGQKLSVLKLVLDLKIPMVACAFATASFGLMMIECTTFGGDTGGTGCTENPRAADA